MNFQEVIVGIATLGLLFGFGAFCAYTMASACLRVILGMVTREQYNVNDCARTPARR